MVKVCVCAWNWFILMANWSLLCCLVTNTTSPQSTTPCVRTLINHFRPGSASFSPQLVESLELAVKTLVWLGTEERQQMGCSILKPQESITRWGTIIPELKIKALFESEAKEHDAQCDATHSLDLLRSQESISHCRIVSKGSKKCKVPVELKAKDDD